MTIGTGSASTAFDAPEDAIAIIGMACRFPGARNTGEFWRNLREGVESIARLSVQDMLDAGVDLDAAQHPQRVAAASTLTDIDYFDAGFFDFSPRQAELTDPQHRLFLECSWEALESAGYDPATYVHTIGMFAGSSISSYLLFNLYPSFGSANASSDLQVLIGNDKDYLVTQVAYKLNLKGPCVNVQTACSTSLVALHMACQSLLNRECDMALAGGVTVRVPTGSGYLYQEGGLLSPDGHCRPFDANAQGTIFGSGMGIVVLKRLEDALADGDVIDAIVRGSAINNDGSLKAGYTAPSEDGQASVIAEALAIAGVEMETIGYVEAHGTGTPLGDPIEIAALTRAFRARARTRALQSGSCAIGAVKSNVGHLESASGIAGLIKTVLALKHRAMPPTLQFTQPNPRIDFAQTPFYINTHLFAWERDQTPRRACVSSFGIGGTNAHVVLEEAPERVPEKTELDASSAGRPYVLPISARGPDSFLAQVQAYRDFLTEEHPDIPLSLHDVCWSVGLRRRHHSHRQAVVGRTRDELVAQLAVLGQNPTNSSMTTSAGSSHKVVFVFPGQGSQWIGMGRQLLEREPIFRAVLEQCDQILHPLTGWSLIAMLTQGDGDQAWFERTDIVQLALFAMQVGLAALWRSLGIEPDAVVGHSMGEVAAAHVAGILSLEDAIRVLYHRNRLIQSVLGKGKMMAVGLTLEQAREILGGHEARVSIAISNSPRSTVLSGDAGALEEIAATLKSQGTFHRWVNVDFASHSPQMDALLTDLRQALSGIHPGKATIPIVSTVTGNPSDGTDMDGGYWARNLREPVMFANATQWLRENDYAVFVEVSPHPVLLPSIEDSLYHLDLPGTIIASLRRDADEQRCMLEALGALYHAGYPVEWDRLYPQGGRFVRLPGYTWHRQRYWVDAPKHADTAVTTEGGTGTHPLLGRQLRSALENVQFESRVSLRATPYLKDHRVCGRAVFPAAAYMEMFWRAAAAWDASPHAVTDIVFHTLLRFKEEEEHLLQTILTPTGNGEATLQLFRWEENASAWHLHASAKVHAAHDESDAPQSTLKSGQARCQQALPSATYYERLREQGLEYGPAFRGIESLWLGDGEAVGQVRLAEALAVEAGAYGLHPALLDACLQLIGATFAGDGASPSGSLPTNEGEREDIFLPVSVASLRIHVPAQERLWGHALVQPATEAQRDTRTGDISLFDEGGQLVAEVRGLCIKRVSRAALQRMMQDDVNDWLYELQWQRKPQSATARLPQRSREGTGHWLILADRYGVGQALAALLKEQGDTATLALWGTQYRHDAAQQSYHIDPARPEDFKRLLAADAAAYCGVIYLWGLDATPEGETTAASLLNDEALICGGALHLIQALLGEKWVPSSRVWMVTSGAQALEPSNAPLAIAQSPLWGLGRSVAIEHPDLHCTRVDLDTIGVEENARALLAEVRAGDEEDQVAYRHGERYAARLVRYTSPLLVARVPVAARQSIQLTIPQRGILDNLAFEPAERRAPQAGEVEIRVRATGLNFRDVLNALGVYPGDPGPLGLECAGEIVVVGEGVDEYRIGDEVVTLAQGCFCTFVTVPALFVARKPERLSFEEAATIPISFMTAYYGLCHLAKMSAGDRVLIHAAAGGLGLAAVQLAQRAGAEVFATAGSEEKRTYLRSLGIRHIMNSRTPDFAAEVMELTGGQGVDIVLNSLTGEFIARTLSILGAGGRFVEVGKIGIWDADRMKQARPDVSYFAFDLGLEGRSQPELVSGMLRHLAREFEQETLSPLKRRVFPLQGAAGAFRFMAQAKHIGKIVVEQEAGLGLSSIDRERFRADCSYLITGGLGGLGLQVARWMVERGARHLALMGRAGASAAALAVVSELERSGAQVLVVEADVARADAVIGALETISQSMPPLRGIVHAAGIIDDGILIRQAWERFARVFASKVQGAWNLHALTGGLTLDFFVLFSSIAAIFGSGGQSSYAAANAFLDGLAHARREQGLPALSVNWGAWAKIGLATRQEVTSRMTMLGIQPIEPEAGVQALEAAMCQPVPQLALLPIDWSTFLQQFTGGQVPPLLSEMGYSSNKPLDGKPSAQLQSELLRLLEETAPYNRRRVLITCLCDQTKAVLGLKPAFLLDPQQPLNELGLDSLMAIELRNRLSSAVAHKLPATIVFDYPTIEGLAGYLAGEVLHLLEETAEGAEEPGEGTTAARYASEQEAQLRDLQQLPEDEVEELLVAELAAMQSQLQRGES